MAREAQILTNGRNAPKSTGRRAHQAVISPKSDAEFGLNYAKQSQFV